MDSRISRERVNAPPVFVIDGPELLGLSAEDLKALRTALDIAITNTTVATGIQVRQGLDILPLESQTPDQDENYTPSQSERLGNGLRYLRLEAGHSQTSLAGKLNTSQSHVSDTERGLHSPSIHSVAR
jgi:hypothetical protein